MNKIDFNSLELLDQISYINEQLLKGESLRTICINMDMGKTTIVNRFTKAKYVFNASTRQYEYQENQIHQEEIKTLSVTQEVATNTITDNDSINVTRNNSKNGNIEKTKEVNIVISKTIASVKPKRVSYYLDVKTIKKIDHLANMSNKGKSEFLQEFLNATLDLIKIE